MFPLLKSRFVNLQPRAFGMIILRAQRALSKIQNMARFTTMKTATIPSLPHINNVEPFSKNDEACFEEIREVLARHGKIGRFGITLLHSHFSVLDDEVLLEKCDPTNRTLTIKPAKAEDMKNPMGTNWRLDVPGVFAWCDQVCQVEEDYETGDRSHDQLHEPVADE